MVRIMVDYCHVSDVNQLLTFSLGVRCILIPFNFLKSLPQNTVSSSNNSSSIRFTVVMPVFATTPLKRATRREAVSRRTINIRGGVCVHAAGMNKNNLWDKCWLPCGLRIGRSHMHDRNIIVTCIYIYISNNPVHSDFKNLVDVCRHVCKYCTSLKRTFRYTKLCVHLCPGGGRDGYKTTKFA